MMLKNSAISRLLTLIFCLIFAQSGQGSIIYVDPDASGVNNGASWSNAYWCLQDALAVAQYGDEVLVADGTYKPDQRIVINPRLGPEVVASGDRAATFQLIDGVTLKGGYAGFDHDDPNTIDIEQYQSILSGDLAGNDAMVNTLLDLFLEPTRSENSYHVVTADQTVSTTILDGFLISAGTANERDYPHNSGGGMRNSGSSLSVLNCIFHSNVAMEGGGVINEGECDPNFVNCKFEQNAAIIVGGGMFNISDQCRPELINCVFSGNFCAEKGGGISNGGATVFLNGCTFSGNLSLQNGGGIFCTNGSNITLNNCAFNANYASEGGGIAYQRHRYSSNDY